MPIKAVFFDIDGTLVDSNEFHVMAWDEAFREGGLIASRERIRSQIGKGGDNLIPSLFPSIADGQQKHLSERHGELFRTRYLMEVRPFPNAMDLIEMLHAKGKTTLLASSAEQAEVDHYVDLLKVRTLIKGSITIDDVTSSKPAGDIFAAALAEVFPLDGSETLAIGDTPYDVESALRSGIKTLAVRSGGFSEDQLAGAGALAVYASVKELFERFAHTELSQ